MRLSDCTDPGDAHARDIKYQSKHGTSTINERTADVDVSMLELLSLLGGIFSHMTNIENINHIIAMNNVVDETQTKSRKQMKKLLEEDLESVGVIFSKPMRVNKPQCVSLKAIANVCLAIAKDACEDLKKDMKILFDATRIL